MDKREAILARLVEIAAGLPGIKTAVRNQDEISERARPAIAVFDADETADERANEQGHAGRAPNLIVMTPEVLILLGFPPESVGSALNVLRAKLIKAVITEPQIATLAGPSTAESATPAAATHLGHGRSMEGAMGVQFTFAYVLRPEQL